MTARRAALVATTLVLLTVGCGRTAAPEAASRPDRRPAVGPVSTGSAPPGSVDPATVGGTALPASTTTGLSAAPAAAGPVPSTASGTPPGMPRSALPRGAATPPSAPPSTPPRTPPSTPPSTVAHADEFSFDECGHDGQVAPDAVAKGAGPGPVVAAIGDSITTQVRFGLLAGGARHWVVWSRCGASVADALSMGAGPAVAALHPAVAVVALGTNDAGYPNPAPGDANGFAADARALLAQLASVPCVVWVNVAQAGDRVLQAEMNHIDADIDALSLRGVRVVRWTDVVAADPAVLVDRVHLSWHGVERRIQQLNEAVARCRA